jgi:hypothetical protein
MGTCARRGVTYAVRGFRAPCGRTDETNPSVLARRYDILSHGRPPGERASGLGPWSLRAEPHLWLADADLRGRRRPRLTLSRHLARIREATIWPKSAPQPQDEEPHRRVDRVQPPESIAMNSLAVIGVTPRCSPTARMSLSSVTM